MRRTLIRCVTLTLSLAAAATSRAQVGPLPVPHIAIGPFLGANYGTLRGDDVSGMSARWDYNVGAQLDVDIASALMFRTGVLYSGRGAQVSDQGVTGKIKLRYLELPLLLGYKFPMPGARPYLIGGGQLGLNTGCTLEGSQGGFTASIECEDPNVGLDIKTFDFGLVGGVGMAVPAGRNHLTFDVRYTLGLTNIAKDGGDVKNGGFTFGVGLMFPLGR